MSHPICGFSVVAVIVMKDNIRIQNVLGQLTRHTTLQKVKKRSLPELKINKLTHAKLILLAS